MVWDSQAQKIYVSMPVVSGDLGNTIAAIDPASGAVSSSSFIGSEPAKLSISSDHQYLYVGMNGANSVQRLLLPGLTPDISWHLGADSFNGPYYARDVLTTPGSPHAIAISLANFDVSPSSTGIVIYDHAVARPTIAPGWNSGPYAYASVQWGSDASTLYASSEGFPTDFYVLGVTASGVTVAHDYYDALIFSTSDLDIHYDAGTGLVYTDGGEAINPSTALPAGNFNASGIAFPDSTLNRVFFLGQTPAQVGTSAFTIQSFDQTTFSPLDSIVVPNVVGMLTGFIRWGTDGVAFTTRIGAPTDFYRIGPGQLYVIQGVVVKAAANAARNPVAEHVRKTWESRSRVVRQNQKRGFVPDTSH